MPFNISTRYAEREAFLPVFIAYITANMARLGVPQETIDALNANKVDWDAKWTIYASRASQTMEARKEMEAIFNTFETQIREIQQSLKNNANITLTPTDYVRLDIHVDKTTRTPATRPIIAPENVVLATNHLTVKVSTFEPDSGNENHVHLPEYATSIARELAITDTAEPPERSAYHAIDNTGRGIHMVTFTQADVDKFGWLITKYVNNRGEAGPESDPCKLRIM